MVSMKKHLTLCLAAFSAAAALAAAPDDGAVRRAKEQLLRPLDERIDKIGQTEIVKLEKRLLEEANALGIGPMGLGGKTTLLGVKVAARTRVPASFFVTIAYMCWACRRRTMCVE